MKIGTVCLLSLFLTSCFGCTSVQKRHRDITTERSDPAEINAFQTKANNTNVIRLYTTRKSEILGTYRTGDLKGVVDLCIQLRSTFGPDSITPEIGLVFAVSLATRGMFDEAIQVGEKTVQQSEAGPDLIQLRTRIAEWHLQLGQQEEAISIYEKLLDTCDAHEFALRSLNKQILASQMHEPMIKPQISEPIELDRLEVGIEPLLAEVAKLLEENRFNEARNLLASTRRKTLKAGDVVRVNQALEEVELAENDYLEEKISNISLKKDIEQARTLMAEERFEEVIERLEVLETESGEMNEVIELKQFAIDKLITRERNRAAGVFLAAQKTTDPKDKQAYLLEALGILNNVLLKYHSSTLNNKIKSNIETVRGALEKIPHTAQEKKDL